MAEKFLLFISYEQLLKLKPKHRKKMLNLGFLPHDYFNPIFFSQFNYLNSLACYASENYGKIINYDYQTSKLSKEQKDFLKDLLFEIYQNGIYPINIESQNVFLTENNKVLLFITKGLVSSNLKNKKLYTKEFITNKIDKFINKL